MKQRQVLEYHTEKYGNVIIAPDESGRIYIWLDPEEVNEGIEASQLNSNSPEFDQWWIDTFFEGLNFDDYPLEHFKTVDEAKEYIQTKFQETIEN